MSIIGNPRIAIILPDARIHKLSFGPLQKSFREAPLTATTLAALVPNWMKARITIVDMSVQAIPNGEVFDLVAISCMTGTSGHAYAIADAFRSRGIPVVMGGVHVTLLPEEAAKHADAIVIGFAEKSWPRLLEDFVRGELKPLYNEQVTELSRLPIPRRELQKKNGYMIPNTVFATRGCKGRCNFCSVPAAAFGWIKRPAPDVIDEIKKIRAKRFVFNDVHLTEEKDYLQELLNGIVSLKKEWGGLASVRTLQDESLLDLLEKSGCRYLLIGFESFDESALRGMKKKGSLNEYTKVIRNLHARSIAIQGCFIFGTDDDDRSVFDRTVQMVDELKIDIPRYAIYTPYPGTDAFKKLESEGRLLHYNWHYYDTQHVVYQPANMSVRELDDGFKKAYRDTFTLRSIVRRTGGLKGNRLIPFLGNCAYWLYINRLYREADRLPAIKTLRHECLEKAVVA